MVRDARFDRRALLRGGVALGGVALVPAWARTGAVAPRPPAVPDEPVPVAVSEQANRPFIQQLCHLIFDAAGLRFTLTPLPWPRALLSAELGKHLVFGLSRSARRDQLFEFSAPIFTSHGWLVVDTRRPLRFDRPEDLRGKTLCTPRGTSFGPGFDALQRSARFKVENGGIDFGSRARMLSMGRCDAMLTAHRGDSPDRLRRRLAALDGGDRLLVLPKPLVAESIHFAVAKKSPLAALLPRIDDAVRRQHVGIQTLVDAEP